MTTELSLPIELKRAGDMKLTIPLVIMGGFISALFWVGCSIKINQTTLEYIVIIPILALTLNLCGAFYLYKTAKPADIKISHMSITLDAIPILGFGSKPTESRNISDFDSIELFKVSDRNFVVMKLALRGKYKKNDIVCDIPKQIPPQNLAQQLGVALKLKVINNA